jgi:DNA-binding NtrC family response regulator
MSVLIADEDSAIRESCRQAAEATGFTAATAENFSAVLRRLPLRSTDVVILSTSLPGAEFPAALFSIKALQPSAEVVLTGHQGSAEPIRQARKSGVCDFLAKPFKLQEFVSLLQRVAARRLFPAPEATSSGGLSDGYLVGQSPEMLRLGRIIERAASGKHPVLILGEKGSGKTSVACLIHSGGSLRDLPFIEVNCAALTVAQLEGVLFGSSADQPALAAQGTVFINSISEMPVPVQGRLLRALQEKEIRPAGARAFPVQARVIAASDRDLESAVQQGTFRRDLYLRLNVVALRMPPLRERRDDIPALVEHFLANFVLPGSSHRFSISPEAMDLVLRYAWPGNVRELEDVLRQAASLSQGAAILPAHLPPEIQAGAAVPRNPSDRAVILPLAEVERKTILETLHQLNGNKQMAAQMLGIGKTTLYRKLKEYGIGREFS